MIFGSKEFEVLKIEEGQNLFGKTVRIITKDPETGEVNAHEFPQLFFFVEPHLEGVLKPLIGKELKGYKLLEEVEKKQFGDKIEFWVHVYLIPPNGDRISILGLKHGEIYDLNQVIQAIVEASAKGSELVEKTFEALIKIHKTLFDNPALTKGFEEKFKVEVLLDSDGQVDKYLWWTWEGVTFVRIPHLGNEEKERFFTFPIEVIYRDKEAGYEYKKGVTFEKIFDVEDVLLIAERMPEILKQLYQEFLRYKDRFENGIKTLEKVIGCLDGS